MTSACIIREGETSERKSIFFNEANTTDYEEANGKCKQVGAILAPVKTVDSMKKIVKLVKPCVSCPWLIGLNFNTDEESGVWSDGIPYNKSTHLKIISPLDYTSSRCAVLQKSKYPNSWLLIRSSCENNPCGIFNEFRSGYMKDALPKTPSSDMPASSPTESDKLLDSSERKKPSPKTTSKVPTFRTNPVRITNRRPSKRTATTKSFPSIVTSSKPVTSSRGYNITSQMTATPSSFFTNITSNPTLLYSLIGGAAFLLLMIFITTFCLCKKSKKKKKTNVGGEDVEMTDKLYQDVAQVADMGLDGHRLTDGDVGKLSGVNKQFIYKNSFSRDASNTHGSTNAGVYSEIMEPNSQGQAQIPECYVYDQVVTPKYRT